MSFLKINKTLLLLLFLRLQCVAQTTKCDCANFVFESRECMVECLASYDTKAQVQMALPKLNSGIIDTIANSFERKSFKSIDDYRYILQRKDFEYFEKIINERIAIDQVIIDGGINQIGGTGNNQTVHVHSPLTTISASQKKDNTLENITLQMSILDRAMNLRNGSMQGQVEAIEFLMDNGKVFNHYRLDGISFTGGNFKKRNFIESSFIDCDLSNVLFAESKIAEANFRFANISKSIFDGAIASKVRFEFITANSTSFINTNLQQSSFFLSHLRNANFKNANLRGACLAFCDLTGADFTGADLTDAILSYSVLDNVIFSEAIIKNTDVSSSVGKNIIITSIQKSGLRRSNPILYGYPEIEIWGQARQSKGWDYKYPDITTTYTELRSLPISYQESLRYREEKSMQPIGTFFNYTAEGQNHIRNRFWFDVEFWETSNRGYKVRQYFEDMGKLLHNRFALGGWIEGDNVQKKNWIRIIEKNYEESSFKKPLILNEESLVVLLLSRKITPDTIDWSSMARRRCYRNAENTNCNCDDSWQTPYKYENLCDWFPTSHTDLFKKWVESRAAQNRLNEFETIYPISIDNVPKLHRVKIENFDGDNKFLLFHHLGNHRANCQDLWTYSFLCDNFDTRGFICKHEQSLSIGIPNVSFVYGSKNARIEYGKMIHQSLFHGSHISFPDSSDQYYIELSDKELSAIHDISDSNKEALLKVSFELKNVISEGDNAFNLMSIPKVAKIESGDKLIWSGVIKHK